MDQSINSEDQKVEFANAAKVVIQGCSISFSEYNLKHKKIDLGFSFEEFYQQFASHANIKFDGVRISKVGKSFVIEPRDG